MPAPLRSMTGFGAESVETDGLSVRAEVRSVNHRFLQVKCRLPPDLAFLEPDVDSLVKKHLSRGAVSVHVSAEIPAAGGASIDLEVARSYRERLTLVSRELGLDGAVTLEQLLLLPGVVVADGGGEQLRAHGRRVLRVIGAALARLVAMREDEGAATAADLRKHAAAIGRTLKSIDRRMPTVVKAAHAALVRRVGEILGGDHRVPEEDLARELALIADRVDVSEELARLASHLEQLQKHLDKGGSAGRKLDFLVQEMFRETNTVGSKCSDAKVAHQVVEMKTLLERLREQVQNVE